MNAFRHDHEQIEENVRYAQELLERHEEELDLEDYGTDFENEEAMFGLNEA